MDEYEDITLRLPVTLINAVEDEMGRIGTDQTFSVIVAEALLNWIVL